MSRNPGVRILWRHSWQSGWLALCRDDDVWLSPIGFVATATASGLLVDAARTPVYLCHSAPVLLTLWAPIMVATVGVLIGTIYRRERMLLGLSPRRFGQTIGAAIGALGIWTLLMPV